MSTEPEQVLAKAKQVYNKREKFGHLSQKATRYLRYNERRERRVQADNITKMLNPLNIQISGMSEEQIRDATKHRASLERDLAEHSPPTDLSGATRDLLATEAKRLEEKIKVGMLSQEEMRRNKPGAVDRNIKWERANKPDILTWKNIQLLLNPDSDEQDLCNIERFRPAGVPMAYDSNAQIPGHFAMTAQAKANWPKGMTEVAEGSPLAQAERRELEELRAQLAEVQAELRARNTPAQLQPKVKTAAQIAASERMKKRWAAKKGLNNA